MKVRCRSRSRDRVPLMPVGSGNAINRLLRRSPRKKASPKVRKTLFFKDGREDKILKGKRVFLDLQASGRVQHLKEKVLNFGGIVEEFLSKELDLVITDKKTDDIKQGWASRSPFSGPSSLQHLSSNKCGNQIGNLPCSTDSPQSIEMKRQEPGQTLRGKRLLKHAAFTQKLGTSDILTNAKTWGVKVLHIDAFTDWLLQGKARTKSEKKVVLLSTSRRSSSSGLKIRALVAPFLKVEDLTRKYKPVYSELKLWPSLHFEEVLSECPFDNPKLNQAEVGEWVIVKQDEKQVKRGSDVSEKASVANKKEKSEVGRQSGYCECCNNRYANIQVHLEGDQHKKFAKNNDNFAALDSVIAKGRQLRGYLNILEEEESDKQGRDARRETIDVQRRAVTLGSPISSSPEVLEKEALFELLTNQPSGQKRDPKQRFNLLTNVAEPTSVKILLKGTSGEFNGPHKCKTLAENSLPKEGYPQGSSLNSKTENALPLEDCHFSKMGMLHRSLPYQERGYRFVEGKSQNIVSFGSSDSAVPSEIPCSSPKQGFKLPTHPFPKVREFIENPLSIPNGTSSPNVELEEPLSTWAEEPNFSCSGELWKSPEQEKQCYSVGKRRCQSPTTLSEKRKNRPLGRSAKKTGSATRKSTRSVFRKRSKRLIGKDASEMSIESMSHKQDETESIVDESNAGLVQIPGHCCFADLTKMGNAAQKLRVDDALFFKAKQIKGTAGEISYSGFGKSKLNHERNRIISVPQGKSNRKQLLDPGVPINVFRPPMKIDARPSGKKLCYEVCNPGLEIIGDKEELTKVDVHAYESVVKQIKSKGKNQKGSSKSSNFVSKIEEVNVSPTSEHHQLQNRNPTYSTGQTRLENNKSLDSFLFSISSLDDDEESWQYHSNKDKATEPRFGSDDVKEKSRTDHSVHSLNAGQQAHFSSSIWKNRGKSVGRPLLSFDASAISFQDDRSTFCTSHASPRIMHDFKDNSCFETCEFSSEAEDSDKACTINVESILTGITSSPIKDLRQANKSVLDDTLCEKGTFPEQTEACRDPQTQLVFSKFASGLVLDNRPRKRSTEEQCYSEVKERKRTKTGDLGEPESTISDSDPQKYTVGLTERTKVRKRRASCAALAYLSKNIM